MGLGEGEACMPPFGTLFVDLASPFLVFPWGRIPSSVQVTIPAHVPVPLPLVLQELAGDPASHAGNVSGAVPLLIQ